VIGLVGELVQIAALVLGESQRGGEPVEDLL
jgi:hypothetical protein